MDTLRSDKMQISKNTLFSETPCINLGCSVSDIFNLFRCFEFVNSVVCDILDYWSTFAKENTLPKRKKESRKVVPSLTKPEQVWGYLAWLAS